MLNVLRQSASWCAPGLKGLGLGPGCDTQQCCVLLPVGILITALRVVKSCGRLYCSRMATTASPNPQALWQWDCANKESNSPLLESELVLVTGSTTNVWQKWWGLQS